MDLFREAATVHKASYVYAVMLGADDKFRLCNASLYCL